MVYEYLTSCKWLPRRKQARSAGCIVWVRSIKTDYYYYYYRDAQLVFVAAASFLSLNIIHSSSQHIIQFKREIRHTTDCSFQGIWKIRSRLSEWCCDQNYPEMILNSSCPRGLMIQFLWHEHAHRCVCTRSTAGHDFNPWAENLTCLNKNQFVQFSSMMSDQCPGAEPENPAL